MAEENEKTRRQLYCGRLRVRARKRERSMAIIKVLIAPPVADKKRFRRLLSPSSRGVPDGGRAGLPRRPG